VSRAALRLGVALSAALAGACGGSDVPPAPVAARSFDDPGFVAAAGYEMRYGMVSASELPAEVAKAYGINRRADRVVVNVSVLERKAGSLPTPVEAEVGGDVQSLLGERQQLEFRAVLQGTAVSYVAEATVGQREPTTFELRAQPPHGPALAARVTREFDDGPR
jgi:hypothetical protein